MKDIEEKLKQAFAQHQCEHKTSTVLDDRVLGQATSTHNKQVPRVPLWRTFMKSKRTWFSGLAAVLALVLALCFMNQTLPAAYALTESIKAMESVKNVSFRAFLYKQQMEILCTMQFQEGQRKPTHVCLTVGNQTLSKVDNELGAFTYNKETNRFRRNRRDERAFNWYPDFRQLLSQAFKEADRNEDVTIGQDIDPNTKQEMITVDVIDKHRAMRYWIDPVTKLPMRMTTQEAFDLTALQRQTIAVRDIWDIHYNEPLPEDTFVIPADAQEVFEEIDVNLRPGLGMSVDELSDPEACLALIEQATAALNALDFETASQLYFPMTIPPAETLQRLQAMAAQVSTPLIEVLEMGEPYQEDAYWYVSCKVKDIQKGLKQDLVRIRFFEFDGIRSCIIAMPD